MFSPSLTHLDVLVDLQARPASGAVSPQLVGLFGHGADYLLDVRWAVV